MDKSNISKYLLSILYMVIGLSGASFAQTHDFWSIDIGISNAQPKGDIDDRYGPELMPFVDIQYGYNKYFGANLGFEYISFKRQTASCDTDLNIISTDLSGILRYPLTSKFQPYLLGGLGLYIWRTDAAWWGDGGPNESADIGLNYGGGFSYMFRPQFGLAFKILNHSIKFDQSDSKHRWVDYTLGIRFALP